MFLQCLFLLPQESATFHSMLLSGNWSVRLPCIIRSIFSYKLQEKILFTLIQTSAAFFLFLNTLTFSMLYLCKVTTVCHSIRNADQNKPNKKNVCECRTQQSGNEDSELPERICTKFPSSQSMTEVQDEFSQNYIKAAGSRGGYYLQCHSKTLYVCSMVSKYRVFDTSAFATGKAFTSSSKYPQYLQFSPKHDSSSSKGRKGRVISSLNTPTALQYSSIFYFRRVIIRIWDFVNLSSNVFSNP